MSPAADHGFDGRLLELFTSHRTAVVVRLARDVTTLGSFDVLMAVAVASALLLGRRAIPRPAALAPLVTLLVTGIVVATSKSVIGRQRPPVALHLVSVQDRSLPSGHAADSAALYLTLALVVAGALLSRPLHRRLVVGAATLGCLLIGLSRLVLGVHWPTDVLAGWALGSGMAVVGSAIGLRLGRSSGRRGTGVDAPARAGAERPPPR